MPETESESRADELERDSLLKVISDVEAARAASTPGTRPLFENALQGAKVRLAVLEKKIKDIEVEKERRATDAVAIAYSAQNEAALNEHEKETYDGFLKEEFFTKKDFGRLEKFYAKTWDRLSEGGKDQMSHRIWAGIRRDEYKFTDLPKVVQEKEAERTYRQLTDSLITTSSTARISENDRKDFIHAYAGGHREEAFQILDRKSFKENLSVVESREIQHTDSFKGKEADGNAIAHKASVKSAKLEGKMPPDARAMREINLDSVNLTGMKAGGETVELSAAELPRSDDSRTRAR